MRRVNCFSTNALIQEWGILFFSLCIGFLFVLLLSVGCSPLYDGSSIVFDTSVFQSVGWLWTKGYPPYLYSWDQKGPIIHGINALGYLLGDGDGNHTFWHMVLEGLSVGVFFFYVYKILRLQFPKKKAIMFLVVTIFILAGTYAGGANIEAFTLPFLGVSYYFTQKWLHLWEQGLFRFNPWYGFLNGFILAFGFLTRLTDAAGICGVMLAVIILLATKREWKNILENCGTFLLGFIVLTLPFIVYFYCIGGLQEMLFGSFVFNVLYATESLDQGIAMYLSHVLSGFPAYSLLAFSVFLFLNSKESRPKAIVWFLATFFMCLWWFPSRKWLKYIILSVPFFPILVAEIDRCKDSFPRWLYIAATVVCCIIPLENLRFFHTFKDPTILPLTERLESVIPTNERNAFMAYQVTPQIYMNLNAIPCYRFHVLQEFFSSVSEDVKVEVHHLFALKKAKWVLVHGEATVIQDILDSSYFLEDDYSDLGDFKLYHRID